MSLHNFLRASMITGAAILSSTTFAETSISVNQGWTTEQRQTMYSQYEGSQIVPYDWFFALEMDASSQLLAKNLSRFGFVESPFGGLPIGMTVTEDQVTAKLYNEPKWLGVNCTVCHTSVLEINGAKILVDGGTNPFMLYKLTNEITRSAQATLNNQEKFNRFAQRLNRKPSDQLYKDLANFTSDMRDLDNTTKFVSSLTGGALVEKMPLQMQAGITGPNNQTLCLLAKIGDPVLGEQVGLRENCRGLTAPTGAPHIWNQYNDEYTHFLGAIHSSFGRNIGQAAGTYAKNWVEKNADGKISFKSTTDFEALIKIEEMYKYLKAPEWNQVAESKVLPKVDENLAAIGSKIYSAKCLSCHALQPEITNANIPLVGRSFWKTTVTPIAEINTDPARLLVDTETTMTLPKILRDQFESVMGQGTVDEKNQVNASSYRAFVVRDMIMNYFASQNLDKLSQLKASNCRLPDRTQATLGYKAGSLAGIAFAAPYLHNDSVPTLDDLLKPTSRRPKVFYTGCRQFDPVKVGFQCTEKSENASEYDTSLPGLSNQGHEYGTDLSESDRKSLIEFIKSIKNPLTPSYGACR